MKISKLKALTIATSVIGTASLGSIAGLTGVAVVDNQSAENQNYSQNGDNGSGGTAGDTSTGTDNTQNGSGDTSQPPSTNVAAEDYVQKSFTNKKTLKTDDKVFDALNQIKSINDLWNFYAKPLGIPDGFTISLDSVQVTDKTPDLNLGLQVNVTINYQVSAEFVIYGFSPYTPEDYKEIFEAANPSGKITKNGKPFAYLDWNDLSKDPNDSNYFGNYFKPIIPVELSANNIIATPDWFNLLPGNVINYHYILQPSYLKTNSQSSSFSISASVPVSSYYEYKYPINTDAYKPVTRNWKPVNFDFIKANLPEKFTRAEFNGFIWKHWNGSTLADAINAYRYWYLFDQSNLTAKLKSYILSTSNYTSFEGKDPIGLIIRGGNTVKDISFNPTYDASMNLNGNKSVLKLNWHLPNLINDLIKLYQGFSPHHWQPPYNIDAGLNIDFDSTKPATLNKDGLVSIPVTITSDVMLDNLKVKQFVYKWSSVVKKANWNVLDALYYYFKNSIILDKSYSTPFFSQFSDTLKKLV